MARKYMTREQYAEVKTRLLSILIDHVGPNNKIGMGELYERVFGEPYDNRINDTKPLRRLITELRKDGQAICSSSSHTNGGYWLAASTSETNDYCDRHKKKALRMLAMVARIKKVSLPDYLGQMRIEAEMEVRNGQGS